MSEELPLKKRIFFDGICNLCNASVQFVLKRDYKKQFSFASFQGTTGQSMLRAQGLNADNQPSFILLENDRVYTRSTAALRVLKSLGIPWSLAYVFMAIPPVIRDRIYDWVADHRYSWFGKRENCWIPSPELDSRFAP